MAVIYMNHLPDATNTMTMTHMAQVFRNGDRFCKYDLGDETNLHVYGSVMPLEYNLTNVKVPTVLLGGEADGFVTKEDIDILAQKLPNVILNHRIPYKGFAHLDFILGVGAKKFVNDKIISVLKEIM